VGQVLSASDVNTWFVPQAIWKPGDEAVTSSTALQPDNDLVATVAANAQYSFELTLWTTGATITSGDIKIAMTWPAAGQGMWVADGYAISGTITPTTIHIETTSGTAHSLGVDASGGTPVRISGSLKTSSTSGSLVLQWAQNTSNATATDVKIGSKLVCWRIG
jgi:hypothetical protein